MNIHFNHTAVSYGDLQIIYVNGNYDNTDEEFLKKYPTKFYTEYLDFFLVLEGSVEVKAFNKKRTLNAGDLFVATQSAFSELIHNNNPISYIRLRFLKNDSFNVSKIQKFSASMTQAGFLRDKVFSHAMFFISLISMKHTCLTVEEDQIIKEDNDLILNAIKNLILSKHESLIILSRPIPKNDLVVRAVDLMEKSILEELNIQDLANNFNISHSFLARSFKKKLGVVPNIYMRSMKLNRALSLMSQKLVSISDISYALGFADQSHFTSSFKKFFHITPGSMNQY